MENVETTPELRCNVFSSVDQLSFRNVIWLWNFGHNSSKATLTLSEGSHSSEVGLTVHVFERG